LDKNTPSPLFNDELSALSGIRHGFFTRTGGVSKGIYEGLNVGPGSKDNPEHVRTNRAKVTDWFAADKNALATAYQIHSADALVVEKSFGDDRPKVDALVTKSPNVVLGVLTADCGPVLFADGKAGVVGAAHAGWKGATGGILESTITAMESVGARKADIVAILGPTISSKNYEVGPEFAERLLAVSPENARWLTASSNPGHRMFDLPGYIVERLFRAGVEAGWTGQCTYGDESAFYSYRRTTHRGEPDYGRQIAAICINNTN